jgi:hypothetical protein
MDKVNRQLRANPMPNPVDTPNAHLTSRIVRIKDVEIAWQVLHLGANAPRHFTVIHVL